MKKRIPDFASDAEAESFVDAADLSDYDFSDFKPFSFEFEPKSKTVTMRLPEALLTAVKARAAEQGVPYQRLIRQTLEREVARQRRPIKGRT
jgi:predicted DNA binding CopG/RHH family protein